MPLLAVKDISVQFGGVTALAGFTVDVQPGEIFAIIGPNGAGKTSTINCISGLYRPAKGSIEYTGTDGQVHVLNRTKTHAIAKLGIARTFQNIALFKGLSVLDNLLLGRHVLMNSSLFSCGIYWGMAQKEEVRHREAVERIIDFLEIEGIRRRIVGTLPYGLQKRVELGRALALEPRLLLLDEPMAGMNVEEKEDMVRFILDANEERGITCVLIEHDMGVVMDVSHRVAVLDFGRKIGEGTPEEVRRNPQVIKAYLGDEELDVPMEPEFELERAALEPQRG